MTCALKLFSVQSVTGGTDAQARVTVRLEEDGKMVDGQGSRYRHHRRRRPGPMCMR